MDTSTADGVLRKRRASTESFRESRAALAVVIPIHQVIATLQQRAATLLVIAERARAGGKDSPTHAAEVEALMVTLAHQRRRLDGEVQLLPDPTRANGRIIDTKRALDSLTQTLDRAAQLLDVIPRIGI